MKNVKFGLGQIGAPTPLWATQIFRVVLYVCCALVIITGAYTHIPNEIKVNIDMYCAQTLVAVHALSKMLGIKIENDPTNADEQPKTN